MGIFIDRCKMLDRLPYPELKLAAIMLEIAGANGTPVCLADMQSDAAKTGPEYPISSILIGAAGENTLKKNAGFLTRDQHKACDGMCQQCAELALYAHCLIAPPAGAGLYTGRLAGMALYLNYDDDIKKMAAMNIDADFDYSYAPNHYKLGNPSESGECFICGAIKPLIRQFWRKSGKPQIKTDHTPQWCATTPKGHIFWPQVGQSATDMAAPLTTRCAFSCSATTESVWVFATCYKQSSVMLKTNMMVSNAYVDHLLKTGALT